VSIKDMAEKITTETGYNVQFEDMYRHITKGLFIKGKEVNIKDIIKPIGMSHAQTIYKNLKLKWSLDTIPYVVLVGAGSLCMAEYLKEFIPHAELQPNAQILAALGMGGMAGVKI
jgi:hypothetical protein